MRQLGDIARANRTDVRDLILGADRFEDGQNFLKYPLLAAHHDRQVRRFGADRAAADRRVEHIPSFFLERLGDTPHCGMVVGAQVDVNAARADTLGDAALAKHHLLNLRRSRHRGHYQIALCRQCLGTFGPLCAGLEVGSGGFAAHVEDADFVALRPG